MQNLSKKLWSPNLNLKDAFDLCIDYSIRARQKNIIQKKDPTLYFAYVFDKSPNLQYYHSISSLFKYSQKDIPETDKARDTVLRLLSVALKCHFFMYENERILHEPYFYSSFDISNPSSLYYSIVYITQSKTIVVSERDIKESADKYFKKYITKGKHPNDSLQTNFKQDSINESILDFPTVVGADSFKWFHHKKWFLHKQESLKVYSTTDKQKILQQIKKIHSLDELQKVAHILNIPYHLKDIMVKLGCLWHPDLNTWYLPFGYDIDIINSYLNLLKNQTQSQT